MQSWPPGGRKVRTQHARQERLPPISFLALRTQLLRARTISKALLYARIVGVRHFLRRFAGQLLLNHKCQCPCFVWGRWFLGQVRHHGWIFGPNFGMLDVQVGTGSRPDISSEFWAPRSARWGRGVPEAGEGLLVPPAWAWSRNRIVRRVCCICLISRHPILVETRTSIH